MRPILTTSENGLRAILPHGGVHQFTGRGLPALAGRGSPSPFVVDLVSGVCIINM